MIRKNKGQTIIALTLVIITFLAGGIIFYTISLIGNENSNGEITVSSSSSQHIVLKNYLPISDILGKNMQKTSSENGIQGNYDFSILNRSKSKTKYVIYVIKDEHTNEIPGSFIKFYLTDSKGKALDGFELNSVPSYKSLMDYNKDNSKIVYSGYLLKNEEKEFHLRVWLSDSYALSKKEEEFSFDVFVEAA